MTDVMTAEILVWLNIILTLGGFITIYVRIAERLTRLETDMGHVMGKLSMKKRSTTYSESENNG